MKEIGRAGGREIWRGRGRERERERGRGREGERDSYISLAKLDRGLFFL